MAPPSEILGMEFEVFLSFRGRDTRANFTSCLYQNMVEKGIRVFKDNKELRVGQKIGGKLLRALEDSQIYIPIFSKGFASSVWCLREVSHMVDCTSKSDGKKEILPVFLDVEPDDVKLRTELYTNALSELEKEKVKYGHEEEKKKYDPDEVERWREALVKVPTRVGWKLDGKGYGELIESIVLEVQLKLTRKNRYLPAHLIETDDLEDIEKLLDVDSHDRVLFIIIHGTGGSGKTTLASVIFNRFWPKFGYSCFLEDVQSHNLLDMQKQLLSKTLGSTSAREIYDTKDGIDRIRRGLSNKRVLLVVDNVDDKEQLKNLAGSRDWFGPGSRIIVTARDTSKIPREEIPMQPSNYLTYPVKKIPLDQAIQLFNMHAFRSNTPPEDCSDLSAKVVSSIGRLPLTLEVVGSLFAGKGKSEWEKTLKDLIQVPHGDVRKTLMISISKLDSREKEIFLDIACFCIGEDQTHAYYMWDDCEYSPHSPQSAIEVLLLMSLIKIDENNKFWMHDELRDLGRYIVLDENVKDGGRRRRWLSIDATTSHILRSNKEKPDVRALSLGINHDLTPEELAYFPELAFLGGERINFVGDFKDSLPNLRWLSWRHCSLNLRATNLGPVNLVTLDLSQSNVTHDWIGWSQIKMAKKLKVLDLTQCYELTKTPDFSEFGTLEKLILARCKKLSMIDSSIGKLKLLNTLNIDGCTSLKGLPEEIGSLEYLSEIIIPKTYGPFELPETLGCLKSLMKFTIQHNVYIDRLPCSIGRLNLTHLDLAYCDKLSELPESIGELKSLIQLDLCYLPIVILPDSIGRLKSLTHLRLFGCKNLQKLPDSIGELESLVELNLTSMNIFDLPYSIGRLKNLMHLLLGECLSLNQLPDSLGELEALVELDLKFSSIFHLPDSIGNLKRLKVLNVAYSRIRKIPCALGGVETLEELDASFCEHLMDEIPWEMWSLTRLRILDLFETPISTVPAKISGFSSLQTLKIASRRLYLLPELPSSLKCLVVKAPCFPVLPDLSNLVHFHLEVGTISPWEDARSIRQLPRTSSTLILRRISQLPDFSNFKSLLILSISGCPVPHFPVLEYLQSLRELEISSCEFLESTPNLSCLKSLQRLVLRYLPKLAEIPGLGELESLKFLHITKCNVIEQLPNLSKLKNLQHLELEDCGELKAVEGLTKLDYLSNAKIEFCMSLERLPDVPASTKLKTNWMPPEAAQRTIQSTVLGKRLRLWELGDE